VVRRGRQEVEMTLDSCPYLRFEEGRREVVSPPSPYYRCTVRVPFKAIGTAYQETVCLTPDYRQCERLALRPVEEGPDDSRAAWIRPAVRRPEVGRAARTRARGERRPVTWTEAVVLGLVISIVFTFLFVGYALAYRLWLGPGMGVPHAQAQRPGASAAEARATLVPTFTPTPPPATRAASDSLTPVVEPSQPPPEPDLRPPANSPPTRLVIPRLDLDIPVQTVGTKTVRQGGKSRLLWGDVPDAGGFHETSAYPGNSGNTVINGHRDILGSVFRHLDEMEPGDEIVLYVGDVAYSYWVSETLVLPETFASTKRRAENLRYIGPMPEERLTLVTCTPIGLATHRLLIIAKPAAQVEPQMPAAGSDEEP